MEGNILARETLTMLQAYPEREYPESEEEDPKKKTAKDKKAPPKKKKKKKNTFPTPDWAAELPALEAKVQEMKDLKNDQENLLLDADFILKVDEQLERFKKEVKFRHREEEEARLALEAKLAAKKKKKK